jgi:deoxycytidine triphosphate deaminase
MDVTPFVDDLVHAPTQTEGRGVDLTVAAVHRVADPGSVDFGGGELEAADLDSVDTERRDPDDEYGWWSLEAGQYLLGYNESLSAPDDLSFVLQARDELRARGAFHPTLHVRSLEAVPLAVGGAGLELKENARVSTLLAE